ncbi:MAG: hypothetical protein K6F50_04670 [Kiritimatiellae bacterium]|nr:hypothetical protein [Kiritimatiellia bacterium]
MNRTIKIGIAALALAATAPAFAQGNEDEGPVGWTPVAIGLATPVQLPWGLNRWDVYGLDLNLFYSDAPKMYGLDVGGLAALTRTKMYGLQVGGLANVALEGPVRGARVTLGLNYAKDDVRGFEAGLVGFRDSFHGLDVNFLASFQRAECGCQISGLANVATEESYGLNVAGLTNLSSGKAYGLQLACIFNYTEELHGAQIGLVNYTTHCPSGFQIGLVNIIMQNQIKVLPFVNGYF